MKQRHLGAKLMRLPISTADFVGRLIWWACTRFDNQNGLSYDHTALIGGIPMPYRFHLPDGANPLSQILYSIGSDALVSARKQMIQVIYEKNDTKLLPRERELMRMLSAKNVGCQMCLAARFWRDLPGFSAEIPEEFYQNTVAVNFGWQGFTERERILMEFGERLENDYKGINSDDEFWVRVYTNFSEEEFGDALIIMSTLIALGNVMTLLGVGSVCNIPTSQEVNTMVQQVAHGNSSQHRENKASSKVA